MQHVGPQVMTCWTNKLLSVVVVVKLVASEDFKLLRISQTSYQILLRYQSANFKGCVSQLFIASGIEILL